jgi:tetratricopeptide (TPR) repeat protein
VGIAVSSLAADKDKKKDKAPTLEEALAEADQKAASGDLDEAVRLLTDVAKEDATGEASLHLGRALEAKHEVDLAIDAYNEAATKLQGPKKGEAQGRQAWLQDLRGLAESAVTAEAAVATDPQGAWPNAALAKARARQGKGAEALELARKSEAAGPISKVALGAAQEASGDLAAAEASYRDALTAPEAEVAADIGLARVLRKTGRAGEAEPLLKKALSLAPGAISAYKESARVKIALGRPAEARGDAATAAALAEGDVEAERLLQEVTVAEALADLAKGQSALAVESLTALRDQHPDFAPARVGLAKAFVAQRQADAALAELNKALELEPADAEANYEAGFVNHMLKGDAAAALPFYRKAVVAEPGNTTYRTNLGAALAGATRYDEAVAELGKVTSAPGYDRPEAWIYLGQAHLGAKRYKEAIPPLQKALALAPDNDQINAFLGWAYFGLKDAENFKKYAGRAKELGHKEPTLLQYLARIQGGEAIK